jgi:hypothetical protein
MAQSYKISTAWFVFEYVELEVLITASLGTLLVCDISGLYVFFYFFYELGCHVVFIIIKCRNKYIRTVNPRMFICFETTSTYVLRLMYV